MENSFSYFLELLRFLRDGRKSLCKIRKKASLAFPCIRPSSKFSCCCGSSLPRRLDTSTRLIIYTPPSMYPQTGFITRQSLNYQFTLLSLFPSAVLTSCLSTASAIFSSFAINAAAAPALTALRQPDTIPDSSNIECSAIAQQRRSRLASP